MYAKMGAVSSARGGSYARHPAQGSPSRAPQRRRDGSQHSDDAYGRQDYPRVPAYNCRERRLSVDGETSEMGSTACSCGMSTGGSGGSQCSCSGCEEDEDETTPPPPMPREMGTLEQGNQRGLSRARSSLSVEDGLFIQHESPPSPPRRSRTHDGETRQYLSASRRGGRLSPPLGQQRDGRSFYGNLRSDSLPYGREGKGYPHARIHGQAAQTYTLPSKGGWSQESHPQLMKRSLFHSKPRDLAGSYRDHDRGNERFGVLQPRHTREHDPSRTLYRRGPVRHPGV